MAKRTVIGPAAALAAALLLPCTAGAALPEYEPQQRLRTALDTCLKDEVLQGAYCVRKCAPDFRMSAAGAKPRCVGLSEKSKYEPPKPQYKPAPANPNAPKVPGA
jgi:hypothetical protein